MRPLLVTVSLLTATTAWAEDPPLTEARSLLSARHAPPCAAVDAVLPEPSGPAWVALAEAPSAIPWVPVRAAACLVAHPEVDDAGRRWVADPSRRGLALAVLDRLDRLPEPRAVALAEAALTASDRWRPVLADSAVPAVRRLAGRIDTP